MKKLEVIIKPFQLDEVKDALATINISDMIISDVRCSHDGEKNSESYLTEDYFVEFLPKIRLEIFIEDNLLEATIIVIKNIINSNLSEHSRIFVYDVFEV